MFGFGKGGPPDFFGKGKGKGPSDFDFMGKGFKVPDL